MWDSFTILFTLALLVLLGGLAGPVLGIVNLIRQSELRTRLLRLEREVAELRTALARGAATRAPAEASAPAERPGPVGAAAEAETGSTGTAPPPPPARWSRTGQPLAWAGGVALALAAVLAAAYGIERGLLSPPLWLSGLALLGVGAFALALTLHRRGERGAVPQALAGAALVAVFAALYAAATVYALLPPSLAFALAALAALATLSAGLRLGAPVILLGALGGYGAPLVVDPAPLPPLPLFAHLGLVTLLVAAVARLRASPLLAWLAPPGLAVWLPLVAASFPPTDASAQLAPPSGFAAGIAVLGLLASRPDLWAGFFARTLPPLSPGQRLAHHLLQAVVAAFLLLGWARIQPEGHAGLLAVILLQPTVALLAVPRGAGAGALVPAALLGVAAVAVTALAPERISTLLWYDPAVGLTSPFWIPVAVRPVLWITVLLVLAFALPGHLLARRGRVPVPAAAAAGIVPLLLLAMAERRAGAALGDLPFAFAALGWGALATLGVRDLLRRRQETAAGLEALAGVAAVALGSAFLLPTGQWPLALAVVVWAALALARTLALAELWTAAGLAATAALLAGLYETLRGVDADSLRHLLLADLLPGLLLVVAARFGPAAGRPVLRPVLEACAEGLLLAGVVASVSVLNGIAPTVAASPLLRDGLALLLWLRFTLLLVHLRPAMPPTLRRLWLLPALLVLPPLWALTLGSSSPLRRPLDVGLLPLWDAPLVTALLPVILAARLARALQRHGLVVPARIAAVGALGGLLWWITLEVRHLFRGPLLVGPWRAGEHLALSLAWTAVALALALVARRRRHPELRRAALAVALLVALKLFLVDLAQLGGLVRIAALAGGGVGLLLIGWLTRPAAARSADAAE